MGAENRARIAAAVNRLAATDEGDVVRLTALRPPQWRLRVGDYRALFRFEAGAGGAAGSILIDRVLHRREAYR